MTRGSDSWGASAAPSPHRTSTGSPQTVCGTTTCTRRRCARRVDRASINGRNHHSNAMACITELATGYPGYNGNVPFENGFLSEILLEHGYNTYAVGKWHLIPSSQETAAGPYNRWPLGRGFERFYGFLGGDTSQWNPDLVYDNHQVEPPIDAGGGIPSHARPHRQGGSIRGRREADRSRQAFLPVPRAGCHARAASRTEGVGGQVRGQLR